MALKQLVISHKGLGIREITTALSLDHQVVHRWLKRYLALGFDGPRDQPKTGRPTKFEPCAWQKLATLVVQSLGKFDMPQQRWSV